MPDEGNHFVSLHAPFQLVITGPFSVWLISSQTRQLIYKPASRKQVCQAAQKKRPLLVQVLRGHSPLCPLFWQQLLLFCWCRSVLTESYRHWSISGSWMHFCEKKHRHGPDLNWLNIMLVWPFQTLNTREGLQKITDQIWFSISISILVAYPKKLQTLCVGITICGSNQWNRNAVVCYCCLLQL